MSKTVTNLLTVAAAIAVNFIPVVGQFLSATLGATLAAGVTSIITSAGFMAAADLAGLGANMPKPDTVQTAIKTAIPPRVRAYGASKLYGAYILYETAANGTACDAYAVHDGKMDGIIQRYLNDEPVTVTGNIVDEGEDGRYRDSAVGFYTTAGNNPSVAIGALLGLLPGIWTTEHRGDGVVIMALTAKAVKAKFFQETYPASGVPIPSIAARWQPVFDWRDPGQDVDDPDTWVWSENPVLQTVHYELTLGGKTWDKHFAPTIDYWTAAADDADEATPLKIGGTEPRYRGCVAHKVPDPRKQVEAALMATFDGWMAPRADGALVVYSGRYYEPTVTIGPDEIISYSWQDGVNDEEAINVVTINYVSAAHEYNTVEAGPWLDTEDIEARGKEASAPLDAQIPSHAQGARLAKRKQAKAMARFRGTVVTNQFGRGAAVQRFINLHIEEAGSVFYSGPAEITALTRNIATGGVTFSWVSADPLIDEWNPATEEVAPAPVGEHVPPSLLVAPEIVSVTVISEGSAARLSVEVESPDRDDLTWYLRWRKDGETLWTEETHADAETGATITLTSGTVPADSALEVQVSYQTGDGRNSVWSVIAESDTSTPAESNAPVYQDVGAISSGVGDVVVALPTAYEIGGVLVLVVETANQPVATPSGWTAGPTNGTSAVPGDSAASGIWTFWKRVTGPETAPTIVDPGDHAVARIYSFRNVSALVNPINASGGVAANSISTVQWSSLTTTVPDCLIIGFVSWSADTTTDQLATLPVNANLTGITTLPHAGTTDGNGGGFSGFYGVKATAGATGTTTATLAAVSRQGRAILALMPPS